MNPKTGLVTLLLCAAVPLAARADDCAAPLAAMRAVTQKSYASTITRNGANGKPETSHAVMTGGKMYVEVQGAWTTIPMTAKELLDDINDKLKTAKMTCHRLPDQAVAGQAASVFSVHSESEDSVSDNTLWLAKSSGLPLKTEIHIEGSVIISLYDYDHVQPPANVKSIK